MRLRLSITYVLDCFLIYVVRFLLPLNMRPRRQEARPIRAIARQDVNALQEGILDSYNGLARREIRRPQSHSALLSTERSDISSLPEKPMEIAEPGASTRQHLSARHGYRNEQAHNG